MTYLSANVRRAYERDRAQLMKRYQKFHAEAAAALNQIEAIDRILSGPEVSAISASVEAGEAGAAAETAPATLAEAFAEAGSFLDKDAAAQTFADIQRHRMGDSKAPTIPRSLTGTVANGGITNEIDRNIPAHVAADDAGPIPEAMRRS